MATSSAPLRPIEDNNRLAALINQLRNADALMEMKDSLDGLPLILSQAGEAEGSPLMKSANALLDWLNEHSTAAALTEGSALAARLLHATGAAEYLNLSDEDLQGIQKNLAIWNRQSRRGAPAQRRRRSASASTARSANRDVSAARTWARANGFDVKDRGRLPAAVLDGYQASLTS